MINYMNYEVAKDNGWKHQNIDFYLMNLYPSHLNHPINGFLCPNKK